MPFGLHCRHEAQHLGVAALAYRFLAEGADGSEPRDHPRAAMATADEVILAHPLSVASVALQARLQRVAGDRVKKSLLYDMYDMLQA